MPYIVLVIDEFSDIMHSENKKEFQSNLCKLAQKSRACGIHIIIATQRPSADVITGIIKANFSARISCKVSSLVDSRVILDSGGAEKLIGKGDSILNANGFNMTRFQAAFIKTEDAIALSVKKHRGLVSKIKSFFGGML
jgi:S-DNA-T family DNA segregation ATPase FtsK/SpoIIIE